MVDRIDLETELDRLYSSPPAEFVALRNDLAKRLRSDDGDTAKRIKKLSKPSVTAWAVNQLAFRARSELEGLKAAGEQVRAAHLAGPREQQAAAKARRDAVSTLRVVAEVALQEIGLTPHRGHRQRISQTLEVLSSRGVGDDSPRAGRLSSDLEPAGFDALSDLAAALAASQKARPTAAKSKTADKKRLTTVGPARAKPRSSADLGSERSKPAGSNPVRSKTPVAKPRVKRPKIVEHPAARSSKDSVILQAASRRHLLDRRRDETRAKLERLEEKIADLGQSVERTAAELAKAKGAEAAAVEAALEAERLAREARARVEAAASVTAKVRLDAKSAAAAGGRVDAQLTKVREELAEIETARTRLLGERSPDEAQ